MVWVLAAGTSALLLSHAGVRTPPRNRLDLLAALQTELDQISHRNLFHSKPCAAERHLVRSLRAKSL